MGKSGGAGPDLILKRFDPKEIEKNDAQKREELQKNSKDITELVFEEYFIVNEVLCEAEAVFVHPDLCGMQVIGGHGTSYQGGYAFYMKLDVEPNNFDLPVRKIFFKGYSPIMVGDKISAKIPKYVTETVGRKSTNVYDNGIDTFYLDRDFQEKETAIEITLLDSQKKPVRTDRSVDYKRYIREQKE